MSKDKQDSSVDISLDLEDLDDMDEEEEDEEKPSSSRKRVSTHPPSPPSEKTAKVILKWIGIIGGILTLVGLLVGYGIWIGGTTTTITTLKADVKDLEDKDTKASKNLQVLVEKLNDRLHNFEVLLTQQQSSIDALRSEIRIRHAESDYLTKVMMNNFSEAQTVSFDELPRRKQAKAIAQFQTEAQKRASLASDVTFNSAAKTLPLVVQDDSLYALEF